MGWIASATAAPGVYLIAEDDDQRTLVGSIKTRAKADLAAAAPELRDAAAAMFAARDRLEAVSPAASKDDFDAAMVGHAAALDRLAAAIARAEGR